MSDSTESWAFPSGNTTPRGQSRTAPALKVADLVCNRIVRLPAWFTVAQARKVVTLRGLEYVLVEERGRVCGYVNRSGLWRALPGDQLARCVRRGDLSISAEASAAQARELMMSQGVECLPVVNGGILIGTLSLADVDFNLEGALALTA